MIEGPTIGETFKMVKSQHQSGGRAEENYPSLQEIFVNLSDTVHRVGKVYT